MTHKEYLTQRAIVQWCKIHEGRHPELKMLFATLNGIRLPIGLAVKAKKMGNRSGVSDLVLPICRPPFGGFWLELKEDASPSKEQKEWCLALRGQGYWADIVHGFDDSIAAIEGYVVGNPVLYKWEQKGIKNESNDNR